MDRSGRPPTYSSFQRPLARSPKAGAGELVAGDHGQLAGSGPVSEGVDGQRQLQVGLTELAGVVIRGGQGVLEGGPGLGEQALLALGSALDALGG